MALFNWDSRLKTNISICDEQHQRLIELINNLHETSRSKADKEVLDKTLNELINYTIYPFQTEEELLDKYNFPYAARHKIEHAQFTNKIFDLRTRFEKGDTGITMETLTFLKDWVNDHIIGTDKNYSAFLRSKGVL